MLPCNVIVEKNENGSVEVSAVNPVASMQAVSNQFSKGNQNAITIGYNPKKLNYEMLNHNFRTHGFFTATYKRRLCPANRERYEPKKTTDDGNDAGLDHAIHDDGAHGAEFGNAQTDDAVYDAKHEDGRRHEYAADALENDE